MAGTARDNKIGIDIWSIQPLMKYIKSSVPSYHWGTHLDAHTVLQLYHQMKIHNPSLQQVVETLFKKKEAH